MPSELEIKNAGKIIEMLSKIEDVSFEQKREDIFLVTEPETGLQLIVDVEETTVCFIIDVCEIGAEVSKDKLFQLLLEINNDSPHGAFCLDGNKVLFKDNLEIDNIDQNELEASVCMPLLTVANNLEAINEIVSPDAIETIEVDDSHYCKKG